MSVRTIIGTAFAVLLISTSAALGQQTPEGLLQSGIYAEEVQGDLEQAMALYRRILTEYPESRAVGATAQLHIGLCLEVLGLGEAGQAYRRVIEDFPEHADQVRLARERLASLTEELAELNRQPTFRKIEIASKPQNGVLSPDGAKLAFVADRSVWMVPLHGDVNPDIAGEPIRLTDDIGAWDVSNLISWSANGEWIAVNAGLESPGEAEARDAIGLVHVGGRDTRVLPVPTTRWGPAVHMRVSISPDGSTLAYSGLDPERPEPDSMPASVSSRYIFTMPVSGGPPQRLTRHWSRQPVFSPDGRHLAYVGPLANQRPVDDASAESDGFSYDDLQATGLWVLPSEGGEPVLMASAAGGLLGGHVWSPDGDYLAVQWGVRGRSWRQQIWVFPVAPDRAEVGDPVKIDLPRDTYDYLPGWTPEGDLGVLIPTESWAAVYTVSASGGKAVQVSQEGWPFNPRWSPDGNRIYARWTEITDSAPGRTSPWIASVPAGGGEMEAIPLRWDWPIIPSYPGAGIHTSPDGETVLFAGYERGEGGSFMVQLWTIPVGGGQPTQLTHGGGRVSNPCWSSDGSLIAFLRPVPVLDGEDYRAIHLIPAKGGEAQAITGDPGAAGIGDIAFSPDGQRIAYLSGDAIKVIPAGGGEIEVLVHIDGFDDDSELAWSPSGEAIAFSRAGRIWVAPLEGGRPQELSTGLSEDMELKHVSWSPDGQKIAFIGITGGDVEFWLISDFMR